MTFPSPMYREFDYFKLQNRQNELWTYLEEERKNKNVKILMENSIKFMEKYDREIDDVTFACSVISDLKVHGRNDPHKEYQERVKQYQQDINNYAATFKIETTTDMLIIPVEIHVYRQGIREGHQCVLVLRRGNTPFWFDPAGEWNMAKEWYISKTDSHVLEIITPILKMMQSTSAELDNFLTIPEVTNRGGLYPWPIGCTVYMHDEMTQIRGQSKKNPFLPPSLETSQYENEDSGICFTTSVVFILGLVCSDNPNEYLTHEWWREFYNKLIGDVNDVQGPEIIKTGYRDFLCTMLHRSIMYRLDRVMKRNTEGYHDRPYYFDPVRSMQTFKNVMGELKGRGRAKARQIEGGIQSITKGSIVRELLCDVNDDKLTLGIEYAPIWGDVDETLKSAHEISGNTATWSNYNPSLDTLLGELATNYGFVLNIRRLPTS
tara:strand:+ start:99 stop:1400 length:1302 start_codon:yes stop_codon:yes gene_type:complete